MELRTAGSMLQTSGCLRAGAASLFFFFDGVCLFQAALTAALRVVWLHEARDDDVDVGVVKRQAVGVAPKGLRLCSKYLDRGV